MNIGNRLLGLFVLPVVSGSVSAPGPGASPPTSEQDISDSYLYLLSRLLILNQQQADFTDGFEWNRLVHREPGNVAWPNPNLDVAYSEAWVAIDEKSCALVTVPKVAGRYYTMQFLNGWGETVANINERVYPDHPDGEFAVCLEGAKLELPAGTQRIDVPVKAMRVLSRVELGADWSPAVALQKKFNIRAHGKPALPDIPKTLTFDIEKLPGVEAFDHAELALDSEADLNPGMDKLQAGVRAIAKAIKDPAQRQRVDDVIHRKTFADIGKLMPTLGDGTVKNAWAVPATSGVYDNHWLVRTLINYGGIWANTPEEVIYYKGFVDPAGEHLNGNNAYVMRFSKEQLPELYATYFWSVIAVDSVHRRVLPNPAKRYLINNYSKLTYGADGSLTLYFADAKPEEAPDDNWLPTPKGVGYSLTFRFYRPRGAVAERTYFPPALERLS
jgi:hypothetical protein